MSASRPRRRVPRGKALDWTDEELDNLSRITPADIARAQAQAPPRAKRLLEAEDMPDGNDES